MKNCDVFINHKGDCKPWVDVLARNLQRHGFKVFHDKWEPVPGKSIVEGLYRGLEQSEKAILVVTPEVIESGWVKEEFHQMMIQKKEDPDFKIIPVVFGKHIPDFLFLKDILWVDFRDPGKYRESFYRLVCAIEDTTPGPGVKLNKEPEIPPVPVETPPLEKSEIAFVEEVFELFFTRQAVVMLAQEDRWYDGMKQLIIQKANERFGEKNIMHLVPPLGVKVDIEDYFAFLGKQAGFPREINSPASFTAAFQERLAAEKQLFLMVSGFENSYNRGQEEFAGVLRSLNESFPEKLRILVSGGEKLADLIYTGVLSYLNHAEIVEWPELTAADVLKRGKALYPDTSIDDKTVEMLLDMSGGHPGIMKYCLDLYSRNPRFTKEDLADVLVKLPYVWQLFGPFTQTPGKMQRLCQLLNQEDLGPAHPYLYSPFLRQLYWRNLLKRSSIKNRLTWRSDALRIAAKRILGCKEEKITGEKIAGDVFITGLNIKKVRHLRDIEIPLSKEERKHLILTGKNASGKTSVLESLKKYLNYFGKKKPSPPRDQVSLTFNHDLSYDFHSSGNFIIAFYPARRKADYTVPKTIEKISLKNRYDIDEKPGKEFIHYIVKLSADRSFARDEFDYEKAQNIQDWFEVFEESLKEILEDPLVRLEFDSENYNFKILQEGKEPFDLNTLADGHSAIIDMVTDIILRMETHKSRSYDVRGIILIDEVETHLHISLQKKILPFLTSFFPKIQFIVTTHSPFVLNSLENAVIYDLEKNLLISDLSGYSYEGIVEGYFDNDKYSQEIKRKIKLYEQLVNQEKRTKDEQNRMMELRMYLREIPGTLAPELKAKFQEIELSRKTKR